MSAGKQPGKGRASRESAQATLESPPKTTPDTRTLKAGTELYRIHLPEYSALWFGPGVGNPPRYRFDAPEGEYGALYVAQSPAGAFAEVFLREPRRITRIITTAELEDRVMSRILVRKPLVLAKLRGPGLSWRGVTAEVSSSEESGYQAARKVALEVFRDPRALDGIEYRSRHDDDELACVLFDRARASIELDQDLQYPCLELARDLLPRYPISIS